LTHELAERKDLLKEAHNIVNLDRPFEGTPGAIRLPPSRPSRFQAQKQFHHVPIREVARAFRTWGPPQHRMSLEPSDLKGAWHQIELSRHIAHRDFEEQGAAPTYSRMPKSAMGGRHTGHSPWALGKRGSCVKGAEAPNFSHREACHDLQLPSDPISILVSAWSK
jgi:hypothetical protein